MSKRSKIDDDEDLLEQEDAEEEMELDEDEEEYEEEYAERRFRFLPALVVMGVVGGFGALAWNSYRSGLDAVKDEDVLLIEADATPAKEKPADPGGMQFPHQDKTVFNTISPSAQNTAQVERVMPAPEEPVKVPDVLAQSETPADTLQSIQPSTQQANLNREALNFSEQAPSSGGSTPSSAEAMEADGSNTFTSSGSTGNKMEALDKPVEISEAPVSETAKPVESKKAEKPKAVAKVETQKPEPKKAETTKTKEAAPAAGSGKGVVQLGAYSSEEKAKEEWERISKKFGSMMTDKTVYYVRADLGAKGIFYRLRASGFNNARSTCADLSAKGQSCMVVNAK